MHAILALEGRPVRRFVHATHPTDEVDPPRLRVARGIEAQRLERDPHFQRPARVALHRAHSGDAVPRFDDLARVIERLLVAHRTLRVDEEQEGVAFVVEGVEHHAEDVAVRRYEVALEPHRDRPLRLRVVVDAGDVEIGGVVQHPHLRAEARRIAGARQLLHEVGEHGGGGPGGVIERAVYDNGARGARGAEGRSGDRFRIDRHGRAVKARALGAGGGGGQQQRGGE